MRYRSIYRGASRTVSDAVARVSGQTLRRWIFGLLIAVASVLAAGDVVAQCGLFGCSRAGSSSTPRARLFSRGGNGSAGGQGSAGGLFSRFRDRRSEGYGYGSAGGAGSAGGSGSAGGTGGSAGGSGSAGGTGSAGAATNGGEDAPARDARANDVPQLEE